MTYKSLIALFGIFVIFGFWLGAAQAEGREVNRAYEYKVAKSLEVINQHLVDVARQSSGRTETLSLPNVVSQEKPATLQTQPQPLPSQQLQSVDIRGQQHFNYPAFYHQPPPRKHYKITVIRNPPRPTAPPTAAPEVEEKTLIYVLVKKPDEPSPEEIEQIQQAQQQSFKLNKPEVYFIKYNSKSENDAEKTEKIYEK